MLITTKGMKLEYEKIQNYIYALIPEKWDAVYLYASVVTGAKNMQNGELYFYYLPKTKGILKKRPINVYEVPNRFNISEEQYLKVVEKLYDSIRNLKQEFIYTEQNLWTNLTISISNCRFRVEYNYDMLPEGEDEINTKHIIWRYKYLKIGGEKKEEKKVLEEYFLNNKNEKQEVYEMGLYIKPENTAVTFDKENITPKEIILYEKDGDEKKYTFERNNSNEREPEKEIQEDEKKKVINQILNL